MFFDRATEAMWSQISKRVVSLLKVGFFAIISLVTFVLFSNVKISSFHMQRRDVSYPFS